MERTDVDVKLSKPSVLDPWQQSALAVVTDVLDATWNIHAVDYGFRRAVKKKEQNQKS